MQGGNGKAILGAWMALVVLAHAGRDAGGIPSYAKVVNVGLLSNLTDSKYPRIDSSGNISAQTPEPAGTYTYGRVFDPDVQGKSLYNYLYQKGGTSNLLPQSLQTYSDYSRCQCVPGVAHRLRARHERGT